jgi:hypothetical protein
MKNNNDDEENRDDQDEEKESKPLFNDGLDGSTTIRIYNTDRPNKRRYFSDFQVLSFEDLEVGLVYELHKGQQSSRHVLLHDPWVCDKGYWVIELTEFPTDDDRWRGQRSMADLGIIPYGKTRSWSQDCWVELVEGFVDRQEVLRLREVLAWKGAGCPPESFD